MVNRQILSIALATAAAVCLTGCDIPHQHHPAPKPIDAWVVESIHYSGPRGGPGEYYATCVNPQSPSPGQWREVFIDPAGPSPDSYDEGWPCPVGRIRGWGTGPILPRD